MAYFSRDTEQNLKSARVVAGFSIEKPEDAVPIAEALLEGGVSAVELTLRTDAGIEAVRQIAEHIPELLLGVGTILTEDQVQSAKDAGAHFGVAPGLNPAVVRAAEEMCFSFAPGIATPTELETAIGLGCRLVKLFPAGALGGDSYLNSLAAPYAHLRIQYFPFGGVNINNLSGYLTRDDVIAVGGSWIVCRESITTRNWSAVRDAATQAIAACPNASHFKSEHT